MDEILQLLRSFRMTKGVTRMTKGVILSLLAGRQVQDDTELDSGIRTCRNDIHRASCVEGNMKGLELLELFILDPQSLHTSSKKSEVSSQNPEM